MAKIIKIISVGHRGGHDGLVNDDWHGLVSYPEPSTVCGIKLSGEDDIVSSEDKNGCVTCRVCRVMIAEIQGIKKWK